VPGIDGYYVAITHSAVTMSAHLGRLVAQEAMGGTAPAMRCVSPADPAHVEITSRSSP
jgi:glycine/D-amino acid oxidase-like deaminating enzyme